MEKKATNYIYLFLINIISKYLYTIHFINYFMTKNNILIASFSIIFSSIFFVINDAIINYLSSINITFYHFVFYGTPAYLFVPLFLLIQGNLKRNLICENYWIPTIRGIIFAPMPFITFVSLKNIIISLSYPHI